MQTNRQMKENVLFLGLSMLDKVVSPKGFAFPDEVRVRREKAEQLRREGKHVQAKREAKEATALFWELYTEFLCGKDMHTPHQAH